MIIVANSGDTEQVVDLGGGQRHPVRATTPQIEFPLSREKGKTKMSRVVRSSLTLALGVVVFSFGCSKLPVGGRALTDSLADSSQIVRALSELRNGDTNAAIQILEQMLDGELLALSSVAEQNPNALATDGAKTVESILEYRGKHPRVLTNAEYATVVSNAMKAVESTASRR